MTPWICEACGEPGSGDMCMHCGRERGPIAPIQRYTREGLRPFILPGSSGLTLNRWAVLWLWLLGFGAATVLGYLVLQGQ